MKQQLYITILLLLPILLQAQVNSCLNTDCGTIQSNWSLVAGEEAIICEGEDFQLRSGESTPLSNINEFHWYFLESSSLNVLFDTVLTDTSFVTYKYTVSDSLACASSSSEIQLSVNLVVSSPSCGGGRRSCNWKLGSVIVKLRPRARFNVDNQQCEDTEISFSNNSCHATEYRWSFGDGTTSTDENPRHTYRNPGTYTVRLEAINDCGVDVSTQTITVVGKPDAAFSFTSDPANQCAPTTVTFNNQSNQWSGTSWSIVPFDTTRWKFTDTSMNLGSRNIAIRFLQAGEYTVRLSANNVCQESDEQEETIVIGDPVRVSLQSPGSFCEPTSIRFRDLNPSINGDIDTYRWTFENGSIPSSNEREFPAVTFNQSGTITLTATGPCGTVTRSVPVTIASTEPIAFGDNPEELCQNAPVVQLQATPAGGQWDGTTNAARDAITSSGELDPSKLNPGTYTFVYSAGSAECPNEDQLRIEILEPPNVELRAIDPACETLTFSAGNLVRYRGTIDTYRWTFEGGNPASSSDPNPSGIVFSNPGTARITIEVDGSCGTASAFIEVEIQSNTPVSIDPVDGPICSGSSPITLTASVGGGIWTGPGISDRFDGTFDPGRVSPGTYTITYSIENGACSNSATTEIQVVASQSVSIQDVTFCEDSGPAAIQVSPAGGTWEGPGIDPNTGVFDPASVGPGNYEVIYSFTDDNSCTVTGTADIRVDALPVINTLDTLELCDSDFDVNLAQAFNYQVNPSGGNTVWSGPGVINGNGIFNAADGNLSQGSYTVFIQYTRNECMVMDSAVVKIVQPQALVVSSDTVVCADGSLLQLEANLSGGAWSGPAINPSRGTIDLDRAGGGTFTYTYTFGQNTSCEQSASVRVEIIDLSEIVNAGDDIQLCEGPTTYTLTGASPANGTWSGPGLINELSGEIDISQLDLNREYTYTYCIESDRIEACEACSERTFVVYSNPVAAFELDGLACVNETFRMTNNSQFGSRYRWDFGDGNSSTLREPEHSYRRRGTYTISLTTTSREGCQDVATRQLFITTAPQAAFDLREKEACAPFELDLTNRSSGDDISYRWEIDGMFYDTIVPENVVLDRVTKDSMFAIKLNVSNLCGEVQAIDSVLVRPYPLAGFGISEDEGCTPLEVSFANVTLGDPDFLEWDNGKGQTFSSFDLPPQIYTTTDTTVTEYTVTLRASNECGADTLSKTITVYPPDVEAFIEMDTLRGCDPLELQLKSFSTPGSNVGWQFIDPSGRRDGSTEKDPIFTFEGPGIHTIILFASQCGTDTDTATLEILEAPEVDFMHSDFVCAGDSILFINNSENITGSEWNFGDGNSSLDNSPFHTFDSAGHL
jgi:PKD repeat protein